MELKKIRGDGVPSKSRRLSRGLSQTLSPEAKLAMRHVQQEQDQSTEVPSKPLTSESAIVKSGSFPNNNADISANTIVVGRTTFSQAYERVNALRLAGDLTEDIDVVAFTVNSKKCIGGGKLENALEIVENVTSADDREALAESDNSAKQDRAQLISLDKCMVWLDVQRGGRQSTFIS